jgi:hypothetical protein
MESNTFEDIQAERSSTEKPIVYLRDVLLERKTPYLTELVEKRRDVRVQRYELVSGSYLMTWRLQGWRLEGLDTKFAAQRKAADQANLNTQMFFRNAMSIVLRGINVKYGIIDNTKRQFRFLDIG